MPLKDWNLLGTMIYGGDYNPDHWPEDIWKQDVELMQEAGVNLVSLGIFSWVKLNPAPDEFTMDWLHRVMDLLHDGGVKVNLATATASPPAWLGRLHPEIRPIGEDGQPYRHGGRQAFTPNSQIFVDHALALIRQLAMEFGSHPALAMWHINNEYFGNTPMSYGEVDARAFRVWLKQRYGDLDGLNKAWGTTFWSQIYTDWEEVLPPCKVPPGPNPSMSLDYKRFFSDAFVKLCHLECSVLRELTPNIPMATNLMQQFPHIDQFEMIKECDFAALDSYPNSTPSVDDRPALSADLTRSLTPDAPWLLMEQVTSQVNWQPPNTIKRPGVMRLWSMSHIARGADGVMFFQWRQGLHGSEKFHGAMVPNCGPEDSRVFKEVCELGADLKKLQPVVGSTVESRVGIFWSWDNFWSVEHFGSPNPVPYNQQMQELHRALCDLGLVPSFAHPSDSNLARFDFLIVPFLYLQTPEQAAILNDYVRSGGKVLVTYLSGQVNDNEHLYFGRGPVHLREMLGLWVEEHDALPDDEHNHIVFRDGGRTIPCQFLFEILHPESAEVLAEYEGDFYAGSPALTQNSFGQGKALYLATKPVGVEGWRHLLTKVLPSELLQTGLSAPPDVERVFRSDSEGNRFLFLLNHSSGYLEVNLQELSGTDLLTGEACSGVLSLLSFEVRVIKLS